MNNMNEMNDKMEVTLNESYTFPVISKESFLKLADIAASTIKTLEPKFKEIKTDFNEGIMIIVANTPNEMKAKADLNGLYDKFCRIEELSANTQMSLEKRLDSQINRITSMIAGLLRKTLSGFQSMKEYNTSELDQYLDYENARERLIAVPVNMDGFDKTKFVCKEVAPGIGYTAKILISDNKTDSVTALVTNEMAKDYGVSLEELMSTALANTMVMFPAVKENVTQKIGFRGYAVNAGSYANGVIATFYPGVLKTVAEQLETKKMIVFLSNKLEALCIPVAGINDTLVGVDETLVLGIMSTLLNSVKKYAPHTFFSKRIYVYDRSANELEPMVF